MRVIVTSLSVAAAVVSAVLLAAFSAPQDYAGDELLGKYPYEMFKKPERCAQCHVEIYQQWRQAMMSVAYTHHWDEIEYFRLAVPHAEKEPMVAGVKAGCNGCHTPLAFMAGDIVPPKPEAGSRANESVSCEVCHTIGGFKGEPPHNYGFIARPGNVRFGPRPGKRSPEHETQELELFAKADLCGNCHNEKSPFGVWVKSTHIEWSEGPYAEEGVPCQDCHMPAAPMLNAKMGTRYPDVRQHIFHGAHDPGKVRGSIEMRLTPDSREVVLGDPVTLTLVLFNGKCGHKVPSGSAEERQLWVRVEATDGAGKVFHLPVDKKRFEGEEQTITSNEPAYFDIGEIMDIPDFKGLERDALPEGDRIFCLPYFDPKGRRTICQWNTASQGVDYRIGPRETKVETYTWELPFDLKPGTVKVRATIYYKRLVQSVADFLEVPADETEVIEVNWTETTFTAMD